MRLTPSDVRVIRAFTHRGEPVESTHLSYDGQELRGNFWRFGIAGSGIARWIHDKIALPETSSKAAQTVQRRIRREAPKNNLQRENPMRYPDRQGKVLVTTKDDRELLLMALESAIYILTSRRQRGEPISPAEQRDQQQLEELHNRIAEL